MVASRTAKTQGTGSRNMGYDVPRHVLVTGLFRVADPAKVGRTPMLVVAGGKDAIFTVEEEKQTAAAYGAELRLFADQAHNLMAEPRWREVPTPSMIGSPTAPGCVAKPDRDRETHFFADLPCDYAAERDLERTK